MGERYLRSIRLLAECMQSFEQDSTDLIRQLGFTHSQFDILATLGNTAGMSCKELGEKTLITKGTLTGVLDRMEQRGYVTRERSTEDRRHFFIKLTELGEQAFNDVFPQVIGRGKLRFNHYNEDDFLALERELQKLKIALQR